MKFIALALLALVNAADSNPGTPCSFQADECGDKAKVCCGIATKGLMCKDDTCGETDPASSAPNLVVCNNISTNAPADFNAS